jgi:hypothetical protein
MPSISSQPCDVSVLQVDYCHWTCAFAAVYHSTRNERPMQGYLIEKGFIYLKLWDSSWWDAKGLAEALPCFIWGLLCCRRGRRVHGSGLQINYLAWKAIKIRDLVNLLCLAFLRMVWEGRLQCTLGALVLGLTMRLLMNFQITFGFERFQTNFTRVLASR